MEENENDISVKFNSVKRKKYTVEIRLNDSICVYSSFVAEYQGMIILLFNIKEKGTFNYDNSA